MLIYLDTNIVIYVVQQVFPWGPRAGARTNLLRSQGDIGIVSDLVRMECRVLPLAQGNVAALAQFDQFFSSSWVQIVGISAAVCDRAAMIRARYRFRALDALHLAAAVEHGAGTFLTNDSRLSRFPDLTVEILP